MSDSLLKSLLKIIGIIVLSFVIATLMAALMAFPVMWVWNWVVPDIFGLKEIDLWHALGLSILTSLLFKSSCAK